MTKGHGVLLPILDACDPAWPTNRAANDAAGDAPTNTRGRTADAPRVRRAEIPLGVELGGVMWLVPSREWM